MNTPSLAEAELVLQDIDPEPLEPIADFVRHVVGLKGIGLTVSTTTDQRAALEGADYVVVTISTGGFDSMRHDLEIPERHGIKQSVGDSVGPGGIMRALRNIPVLVGIARDMEEICPDAWMLNITNPMTTLCRAMTHETSIRTVGLCHEIAGAQFALSTLLDVGFLDLDFEIVGVNHLPIFTALRVNGEDAFPRLRALIDDPDGLGAEPIRIPSEYGEEAQRLAAGFSQARSARAPQGEARAVRTLRRAAGRGRPAPRRVLPRLPHRGVGVGQALGRRAHDDRRSRGRRRAVTRRSSRRCAPRTRCRRCRRARWSRR